MTGDEFPHSFTGRIIETAKSVWGEQVPKARWAQLEKATFWVGGGTSSHAGRHPMMSCQAAKRPQFPRICTIRQDGRNFACFTDRALGEAEVIHEQLILLRR